MSRAPICEDERKRSYGKTVPDIGPAWEVEMITEKRDRLAAATALVLPPALKDIEEGLILIKSGRGKDGVVQIEDAAARLKVLVPLSDQASRE